MDITLGFMHGSRLRIVTDEMSFMRIYADPSGENEDIFNGSSCDRLALNVENASMLASILQNWVDSKKNV